MPSSSRLMLIFAGTEVLTDISVILNCDSVKNKKEIIRELRIACFYSNKNCVIFWRGCTVNGSY